MKKLYGSFAAKLIAVILLCVLVLAFFAAGVGAAVVYDWDGYTTDAKSFRGKIAETQARSLMIGFGYDYRNKNDPSYLGTDPNLRFAVLDGNGDVRWTDYEGQETLWTGTAWIEPNYDVELVILDSTASDVEGVIPNATASDSELPEKEKHPYPIMMPSTSEPGEKTVWDVRDYSTGETMTFTDEQELSDWEKENSITVRGYVLSDLQHQGEIWTRIRLGDFLYSWRYAFLWIAVLSFLLGVLDFIFLLCAAGHRKDTEAIVPSFVEKIPFDLFTLLVIIAMVISAMPTLGGWPFPIGPVILIPCGLLIGLLFLLWCVSFAVRVKLGTLWSGCLIVRFFRWLWQGGKAIFRNLPILWKWGLGLAAAAFVDLIFRMNAVWSENRATFFWFLFWLLIAGITFYAVLAFRRLRKGAKEIASGNMGYIVDEKNLILDFKDHAHDLNHIRDGMNAAVEERMKSERFRTELITNVSHDIKTPLTSIVNYVDLLAKEEPENDKQREYLEVLSRQSAKLKKLIEDLIEASKASTGALAVTSERCDLGVLLDQTAGEYSEKLSAAGLELVQQKPREPVIVWADGRHLWRIFDNLMNNIVKYAMPGTRVYLSLEQENGKARVTFRNISREPLAVSGEELTERFVRGDSSRNTEGSGLGLSIAMSLAKLQKGELDIRVDGDLFKVTLELDTVS